jgi:hypothetical protein
MEDEVALLLVFVKINSNEAYGVERVRHRFARGDDLGAQLLRFMLLEEGYHTRLLLSAAALFGLRIREPVLPARIVRAITAGIAELPDVASRPVLLTSEIVAIVTFLRLIGAVRRVFRAHPAVRDALEERVTEVLIDEVGHLSLNRLLAFPSTFAAVRGLLPIITLGTHGALPEAEVLRILPIPVREVASFELRTLPEEVRRRAFIA